MEQLGRTSYTIPAWDLKITNKQLFRKSYIEGLSKVATRDLEYPRFTIRELTYSDLGLTSWNTPGQSRNSYNQWISHTIGPHQIFCVYGMILLSEEPKVSELKIGSGPYGSVITGIHAVDKLKAVLQIIKRIDRMDDTAGWMEDTFGDLREIKMEGYFSEPYIWRPRQCIWMSVKSSSDNPSGDTLFLNGFIAEVEGLKIA